MGPMGMARSGGQILFDLAIKDIDSLLGSKEKYAASLYSYFINKGEPTENFHRIHDILFNISMVAANTVTFVSSMARVGTVEILGKLRENQKDSN
jgi:hypothetical protein